MNRRHFLKNSALALFGFTVLPPSTTYERIWKVQRKTELTQRVLDSFYIELIRDLHNSVSLMGDFSAINIPQTAIYYERGLISVWQKVIDAPPLQA